MHLGYGIINTLSECEISYNQVIEFRVFFDFPVEHILRIVQINDEYVHWLLRFWLSLVTFSRRESTTIAKFQLR